MHDLIQNIQTFKLNTAKIKQYKVGLSSIDHSFEERRKILKGKQREGSIIIVELIYIRSSHPELFLSKDVLKICSKFTGEQPC